MVLLLWKCRLILRIQAYLSLVEQDSSAWAWEIDCKLARLLLP